VTCEPQANDTVQSRPSPTVNPVPALNALIQYLDGLLDPDTFADYGPNGLQVPGKTEIATVATGVSAHGPLLERAVEAGADLVLVHHGLFWRGDPLQITPILHRRLKLLYAGDIALAAYHLPLDAHPEHGNNALLADALGLAKRTSLAGIGVAGRLPGAGLDPAAFGALLRDAVGGREPLHLPGGPDTIRSVGIVTGAATDNVIDAIAAGLDAYVTGEPAERALALAADGAIHFYAAGHHATETFGVRRLGELLEAQFGVRHVWLDVENPI
jgi:dinuclear metal center YbgI/SA1388 family protein